MPRLPGSLPRTEHGCPHGVFSAQRTSTVRGGDPTDDRMIGFIAVERPPYAATTREATDLPGTGFHGTPGTPSNPLHTPSLRAPMTGPPRTIPRNRETTSARQRAESDAMPVTGELAHRWPRKARMPRAESASQKRWGGRLHCRFGNGKTGGTERTGRPTRRRPGGSRPDRPQSMSAPRASSLPRKLA